MQITNYSNISSFTRHTFENKLYYELNEWIWKILQLNSCDNLCLYIDIYIYICVCNNDCSTLRVHVSVISPSLLQWLHSWNSTRRSTNECIQFSLYTSLLSNKIPAIHQDYTTYTLSSSIFLLFFRLLFFFVYPSSSSNNADEADDFATKVYSLVCLQKKSSLLRIFFYSLFKLLALLWYLYFILNDRLVHSILITSSLYVVVVVVVIMIWAILMFNHFHKKRESSCVCVCIFLKNIKKI